VPPSSSCAFIILGRASSADPQKQCAEKLQEDARDKEDEGQGEHAAVRRPGQDAEQKEDRGESQCDPAEHRGNSPHLQPSWCELALKLTGRL